MKSTLGLALSLLFLTALTTGVMAEDRNVALAKFKNVCFTAKGTLKFDNGQWSCVNLKPSKGLEPITISFPKD
jgi:hypothetical protein